MSSFPSASRIPGRLPGAEDRAAALWKELQVYGSPEQRFGDPQQEDRPGFIEQHMARMGHNWLGATINRIAISGASGSNRRDDGFNPFEAIKKSDRLKSDPKVKHMVELGMFDGVYTQADFDSMLVQGEQFFHDLDVIRRSTWTQAILSSGVELAGDPTNLIPIAAGARVAGAVGSAARITKYGALAGSINLAMNETTNLANPLTETPGPTDELISFGAGAAMASGVLGVIEYAAKPTVGGIGRVITRAKVDRLKRDYTRAMDAPLVREFDAATPLDSMPVEPTATLDAEIARARQNIAIALDDEPVDIMTVSALHRKGDATDQMIQQLQKKYDDAGVDLQVIDHPDQHILDTMDFLGSVLKHPTARLEATNMDINRNAIDAAFGAVAAKHAGMQSVVTPGGRIASTMIGRYADAYRTLSGSAGTITKASADQPFKAKSGASAEGILTGYGAAKEGVIGRSVSMFNAARKSGNSAIVYNGESIPLTRRNFVRARELAIDHARRQNAQRAGYNVAPFEDADPLIAQMADMFRDYFRQMRDEMELAGMLDVGPQALGRLQAERELISNGGGDNAEALAAVDRSIKGMERAIRDQEFYLPRVFNVEAMAANPNDVIRRFAAGFRRQDDIVEGVLTATPDERRVIADVVKDMDMRDEFERQARIKRGDGEIQPVDGLQGEIDLPRPPLDANSEQMGAAPTPKPVDIATLSEGDLPPALRKAYRARLDRYYLGNARAAFDHITDPKDFHGVSEVIPQDPIRRRVMDLNEADLADYLETDPWRMLDRYDRVVSGRTAVRRAIQLNPQIWEGVVTRDGKAVIDGQTMMKYLNETADGLSEFARIADKALGDNKPLAPLARTLQNRVKKDFAVPMDIIEGRRPVAHNPIFQAFDYFGRVLVKASFANKLGSVAWSMTNDFAPMTLYAMQRPRQLLQMGKIIANLDDLTLRELEVLGITTDAMARTRALSDADHMAGYGFGHGQTKQITGQIEMGIDKTAEYVADYSGMNYVTTTSKKIAGAQTIDKVTHQSKLLLRAQALIDGGMDEAAALRKVGLSRYDATRINHMGLNADRASAYHKLAYDNGFTLNDARINEVMSFDEYMASNKVFKPAFSDWDVGQSATKNLLDTVRSNIADEVHRSLVVSPGRFDRPLFNMTAFGRVFNQFQSFGMAFVNQRLKVMSQMPARYQLWYVMNYLGLGAMSDAIKNHMSGRRALSETAKQWSSNPLGMTYAAWNQSGLSGWLARPMAWADATGTPLSPSRMFGNELSSSASYHYQQNLANVAGPGFGDLQRVANIGADVVGGRMDKQTAYQVWRLAPGQNLLWLRAVHATTGLPVVPEALQDN